MKNKINIAELLKNCPKGMELDCTICNGVKFIELDRNPNFPIVVRANNGYEFTLTKYGQVHNIDDSKCVIFPKGKTTWEGFVPPCKFKDGDILITASGNPFILKKIHNDKICESYCGIRQSGEFIVESHNWTSNYNLRFATEEEKQKLFQAVKENGYKWHEETKTLEKLVEPKFKVGDIIRNKETKKRRTVTKIHQNCYECDDRYVLEFKNQDYWEIVPNKFDISTLVPFESRVLVRDSNREKWKSNFWGFYDIDHVMNYPYECCGASFAQCIPYEGNEHLLGTNNDCDKYFKIWES